MNENIRKIIEQIEEIYYKSLPGDFNEAISEIVDKFYDWEELEDEIRDKLLSKVLEEKLQQEGKVREISERILNLLIEDLTNHTNFTLCMQAINQNTKKLNMMKKKWLKLIQHEIEKTD